MKLHLADAADEFAGTVPKSAVMPVTFRALSCVAIC